MDRPWLPERRPSSGEVRRLLAERFEDLELESVEELAEGWDNTAFLVDGELVFRFPRRQMAVDLLRSECGVLPELGPRLPLPVPEPRWVGEDDGQPAWPFAGYRCLAGTTADRLDLDDAARRALAPALGEFLAALHRVEVAPLEAVVLPRKVLLVVPDPLLKTFHFIGVL